MVTRITFCGCVYACARDNSLRMSRETVAGHYLVFLEKTTHGIGCLLKIKGYYIVMNNVSIHTAQEINGLVVGRGYKPILSDKISSFPRAIRISEVCVPPSHLHVFVHYFIESFEKRVSEERI